MKKLSPKQYLPTEPCSNGHLAPRYKIGNGCTECMRTNRAAQSPEARARAAEQRAAWRAARPTYNKDRRNDKVRAAERARYQEKTKGARLEKALKRRRENDVYKARRYQLRAATPSWVTEEMHALMREFYRNTPPGKQVDHIVPVKGRNVCGLHVPWNLQYLTPIANQQKSTVLTRQGQELGDASATITPSRRKTRK